MSKRNSNIRKACDRIATIIEFAYIPHKANAEIKRLLKSIKRTTWRGEWVKPREGVGRLNKFVNNGTVY